MRTKGAYILTKVKRLGLHTAVELDLKHAIPGAESKGGASCSTGSDLCALRGTCEGI